MKIEIKYIRGYCRVFEKKIFIVRNVANIFYSFEENMVYMQYLRRCPRVHEQENEIMNIAYKIIVCNEFSIPFNV